MLIPLIVLLVTLLIAVVFIWPALTNPFSRWSLLKRPFTTSVDDGKIVLKKHFSLKVREGAIWNVVGMLKAGIHIIINVYAGSPKAKAKHEEPIIDKIHTLRFKAKYPFIISGDHFAMLYPRSLGIFYHSLMDPRTARSRKDWQDRQAIYLRTTAYALEVYSQTAHLSTTIAPIWKRSVLLTNVFNPPVDTLYSLLYALHVMSGHDEPLAIYPSDKSSRFHINTKRAAKQLLADYGPALVGHLKRFADEVYDRKTGLVRQNVQLSGAKDISLEYSGFYENVIFWKTNQLAMELGLAPKDPVFLAAYKARIIKNFWLPNEGHFLEDLSNDAREKSYYSSDWLVVLMTGFLSPLVPDERDYFIGSLRYIQTEKLDQPFGLKYQQQDRASREHFFDRNFVPDYGGTAIWSHWGMEYIKALILMAQATREPLYLKTAGKQLAAFRRNIEKYRGYPEVYHKNGKLFSRLFYKSVRQTGWVVSYEQAKMLYDDTCFSLGHNLRQRKHINLILGPGAARGIMHVGAIRALLEHGYKIETVYGNSAGSFVAVLYAYFQDIDKVERIVRSTPFTQFLKHDRSTILSIDHDAIKRYFEKVVSKEDLSFDELGIPLALTVTDLITGRPAYLYTGKVLTALLASASLPLINAAEYIHGTPYTDGGIIYNMPDKIPAELNNAYPYLGINVAYDLKFRANQISYWRRSLIRSLSWIYLLKRHHARLLKHELYDNVPLYEIIINDHLIRPTDFRKISQLIRLGYRATKAQLKNAKLNS